MPNMITSVLFSILGLFIGIISMIFMSHIGLNKNKLKAKQIVDEAEKEAKNTLKQAALEGKTQVYDLKLQAEKEIKERRLEIQNLENKLLRREDSLNFRETSLSDKEKKLDEKLDETAIKMANLNKMESELQARIDSQLNVLEQTASMSREDARKELLALVEKKIEHEVAVYVRDKEDEAHMLAQRKAQEIIALAIQRYSQEEAIERTVSVVTLPSEDMKGRIIGREGRNIRAIEQATGVDLIIDDTPEVITVSCFNPIRREIARQALEILIKDGRIQPGRIEEVVGKVSRDLDEIMMKAGQDAIFRLQLGKMHKDLIKTVGRLKYRYSYGQNVLEHCIEVGFFCGAMAVELGLNQQIAKRAGLLHDIGKAVDFEVDGTHVELGVKLARKYGECETVINAIEAHHGDTEPTSLIANLVIAADTLSAARPGARSESVENYINRLESLEKIATDYDGVEKAFAIQAGREIRVMVVPDKVDDYKAHMIARQIKERIENELTYPGQIKVTVIRELRANEIAK